jgi:hypothetical protein
MPTFRQADKEDRELLAEVIEEFHPEFLEHKVKVSLWYVHATRDPETGEKKGPAIKANRIQAADYAVKVCSYERRVKGSADAEIHLDGDEIEMWTDSTKRARLDEAMRELELVWEDVDDHTARVKTDDAGRPKLRKSVPDVTMKLWYDVAERHGLHATAVQALQSLRKDFVQGVFPEFAAEPEAAGVGG